MSLEGGLSNHFTEGVENLNRPKNPSKILDASCKALKIVVYERNMWKCAGKNLSVVLEKRQKNQPRDSEIQNEQFVTFRLEN